MASFARRALATIAKLLTSSADPSTDSTAALLYSKLLSGTRQLFAMDSTGLVYQGTPYLGLCKGSFYLGDDFAISTQSTYTIASSGTNVFTTAVQGAPGIVTMSVTSAVGPSRTTINPAIALGNNVIVGGNVVIWEGRCRTPIPQDGTDQWSDRWGLGDVSTGADTTDGVYFDSDRAVNGDNNVRLCTSTASVRTKTSMGVAPGVNFERWKLIINAAGTSVQGYLNDTATGSAVTTNIPTATATGPYWAQLVKTLGTTARVVDRDYLEMTQVFSPTTR